MLELLSLSHFMTKPHLTQIRRCHEIAKIANLSNGPNFYVIRSHSIANDSCTAAQAFPEGFFTHALALKSNSMRTVLATAQANYFMGAECASIGEVVHAVQCGFHPTKVVYDSPVKSKV